MTWDSEKQAFRARRQRENKQISAQDEAKAQVAQGRAMQPVAVSAQDDFKAQIRQARAQASQQDRAVVVDSPDLPRTPIQFGPFTGGLVTNAGATLRGEECADMVDWSMCPDGDIASRRGFILTVQGGMAGECRQILYAYTPNTTYAWRTIICDNEGYVYCVEDGETFLKPICKLNSQCFCVSFSNKIAVLASDYIRYWDGGWSTSGAEMVTHGDMSVSGSWTITSPPWTIASGVGTYDGTSVQASLRQNVGAAPGAIYKVTYTVTNWTQQEISSTNQHWCSMGGDTKAYSIGQKNSGNGTFECYLIRGEYNGLLYIFADSGYSFDIDDISVKEVDALPLAYDNGTGPSSYMYQLSGKNSWLGLSCSNLYQAVARVHTTDDWGDGTVTPTRINAFLRKTGSPTGDVEGHIYDSTGVLVASCSFGQAENLGSADFQEYTAFIDPSDVVSGLSSDSKYYICVAYWGGDVANTVDIQTENWDDFVGGYAAITSIPGHGGWSVALEVTSDNLIPAIGLSPGLPPKLSYGVMNDTRLFGIEGDGADNPSYLWYSGAGNMFDWSTPGVAGYDDIGNPIGVLSTMFKNLWLWGTEGYPFLLRQTGEAPAEWTYPMFVAWAYGYPWSVTETPEGTFFVMRTGVYSLRAVETYQDIQRSMHAPGISDAITAGWDTDHDSGRNKYAMAYDPLENVVVLKPNTSGTKAFVVYLNAVASISAGASQFAYHPGGEWDLDLIGGSGLQVCFGVSNGYFLSCDSDGNIYELSINTSVDYGGGTSFIFSPSLLTGRYSTRFGEYRAIAVSPGAYSTKVDFDIDFYINYSALAFATKEFEAVSQNSTLYWTSGTAYVINNIRTARDGNKYVCTADHTSSTDNEPGTGKGWSDYWDFSSESYKDRLYSTFLFRNLQLGMSGVFGADNERLRVRDIIVLCENLGGF